MSKVRIIIQDTDKGEDERSMWDLAALADEVRRIYPAYEVHIAEPEPQLAPGDVPWEPEADLTDMWDQTLRVWVIEEPRTESTTGDSPRQMARQLAVLAWNKYHREEQFKEANVDVLDQNGEVLESQCLWSSAEEPQIRSEQERQTRPHEPPPQTRYRE